MNATIRSAIAALLLLPLVGGCATTGGTRYHNLQMDFGSLQSVAVLPFANLTRDQAAGESVRDVFTTMLLATGAVYVVPPGETFRGLSRANPLDPTRPSPEEVKRIAGIVSVDAVITGIVREFGEARSGQAAANVVSVTLQMIEAETGLVVWTGSTTKGGVTWKDRLFGGGGQPMNKVIQAAVEDLLDKFFEPVE
ncbi:MAG: DUF799 family lipoprotein [Deferrisomatales bacterium]|nr:DUF799 family lipoprotein [Deferrisomatales bacterium]